MSSAAAASSAESPPPPVEAGLLAPVRAFFRASTESPDVCASVFTTAAPELYPVFLDALPPELRQLHNCSACRRFVRRYGGLVRVGADGRTVPVLWDAAAGHETYGRALRALAGAVAGAPIEGVFLSEATTWGVPRTGEWTHLAVEPPKALVWSGLPLKNRGQVMAEKKQDFEMLCRGLQEFSIDLVNKAHSLLTSEALYRSEKCIGVAKWLLDLHEQRAAAKGARARDNVTWLAVASAPSGFCHVRTSMIGTLLEDLAAGLPFDQIKGRFDAKMNPLQYQRPTAAPSAGNIAQAEKIIEKLKAAGALERRFARLSDIQPLWVPARGRREPEQGKKGVFSHLLPGSKSSSPDVEVPATTITWEKFARTVLPKAESIDFLVPAASQAYLAMVTASNPDAPPIVQWDLDGKRNPVTWYVYTGGSTPQRWGLKAGAYHPVSAVSLQPSMWNPEKSFAHQGEKAIFLLEGAKDLEYKDGAGFFPEFLKSEYHAIRATMEAYAKTAVIAGKSEAEACGICLQKGLTWNHTFRVATKGVRAVYKLDRWD